MTQQKLPLPDTVETVRAQAEKLSSADQADLLAQMLGGFLRHDIDRVLVPAADKAATRNGLRLLRALVDRQARPAGPGGPLKPPEAMRHVVLDIAQNPMADEELVTWAIRYGVSELLKITDKDRNKAYRPDEVREPWFTDERVALIIETHMPIGALMDWMGHYMLDLPVPLREAYLAKLVVAERELGLPGRLRDSRREQIVHLAFKTYELSVASVLALWEVYPMHRDILLFHRGMPEEVALAKMGEFCEDAPIKGKPHETVTNDRRLFEAMFTWPKLPTKFMYFFMDDPELRPLIADNPKLPADLACMLAGFREWPVVEKLLRHQTLPQQTWQEVFEEAFRINMTEAIKCGRANPLASPEQLSEMWLSDIGDAARTLEYLAHPACSSKLYWQIVASSRRKDWWGRVLAVLLEDESMSEAKLVKLCGFKQGDDKWIDKFPASACTKLAQHPHAPLWALEIVSEYAGPQDARAADDNIEKRKARMTA